MNCLFPAFLLAVLIFLPVFAVCEAVGFGESSGGTGLENPIGTSDFSVIVKKITALVAKIGSIIAALMVIWSGFLFTTARGDTEQLKKARSTFYYAVIGAAVLLGAYAIAAAVSDFAQKL